MPLAFTVDQERLAALCRRHRVARLELFGSRAKGTARADSDVDLLVTFETGYTPSYLAPDGFMALLGELEELLHHRVDLLTRPSVESDPNEYFRRDALRQTETLYAA